MAKPVKTKKSNKTLRAELNKFRSIGFIEHAGFKKPTPPTLKVPKLEQRK